MHDLVEVARNCLLESCPKTKMQRTAEAVRAWRKGELNIPSGVTSDSGDLAPALPVRPRLVSPSRLARRSLGSHQGRAALIHAIAHIEYNAINLAWDAVWRFRDLPAAFYDDWVGVADDEARHFSMLQEHLEAMGYAYGDFDAHTGLWDMAMKTAHDPLARMAMVHRMLEARGLDVTPPMIEKLKKVGDVKAAGILQVIMQDEIRHVAAGNRWFNYLCELQGFEPETKFRELLATYVDGFAGGPFNYDARLEAGFSISELEILAEMTSRKKDSGSA